MRKTLLLLVVLALVPFAFAACGGDDDGDEVAPAPTEQPAEEPAGGGAATTIQVSAEPDGSLAFEQESLTAKAEEVAFEFENPAALQHDFVIEDQAGNEVGRTDVITESTDTLTVSLEPGKYTFYCSVDGHREAGMEGPLTVK